MFQSLQTLFKFGASKKLNRRTSKFSRNVKLNFDPLEDRVTPTAGVSQLGVADQAIGQATLSFAVPAGDNRLLIVAVADDDSTLPGLSISFSGTPLTRGVETFEGGAMSSMAFIILRWGAVPR